MEVKTAYGVCPNCGRNLRITNEKIVMYGSPVQTCKKCRKPYLDTRYQEYAITGIPERELSVKHDLKVIGILAAFGIISTGINVADIWFEGEYYIMLAMLSVLSPIMVIVMLVDIIRIMTGAKGRKLEQKRLESVERLRDPDYALLLYQAGYLVPAEYLPAQEQDAAGDVPDFVSKGETAF